MGEHVTDKQLMFEEIARVGKALASGKRLELLDLLAQAERTVEALAKSARLGVSTASAHLQTLKQGGLVATRREGTRIYYRLASPDVARLYANLRDVATTHLADVAVAVTEFLGPEVEHVTRDDLLDRVRRGDVVVLDVRPAEEYAAGHIPGAVSIPLDQLADRLTELPADTEIVAYCRGVNCVLAPDAVRLLSERGRAARQLADGMLEWRLAELPVEAGSPP
ncbi:metalloregulator ArsR/SmtB family transcription factor [Phytoactinopolyspora alkaliphila]|uniref:Metalloregulator ArsR/SmtB family transcription factor n=1 Tax=Phytoactinopolyspora alkaliphila TaxID=1783498 RepID=A0A6N9YHY1_9ACTN|nr:metalloregulator ArsR/SmtB family transcription factor [Phytoactinopolyspora alkaliphila]NED94479.1 metalloregulator ArsR/SmtB family transcription factor [Phytoactinopolyspora alkaliphila]